MPYRLGKLRAVLPVEGRWLDCGCADGSYAAALLEAGAEEVVGVDVAPEPLRRAEERWDGVPRLSFLVARAEQLPFADESFDGVLLNEVLEHVASQTGTLAEIRRVLAPGGSVVVFSPNRWFPFEGHGAVLGSIRLPFPVPLLPWLPQRLTWRAMTARNYWPHQLVRTIREAGFRIDHVAFAFPLFARYRWLPGPLITAYLRSLSVLERLPLIRRLGVSTFVVATKPAG